jgi:hypothetical protein
MERPELNQIVSLLIDSKDVSTWPLWENFPFKSKVPEFISVHKLEREGIAVRLSEESSPLMALWWPEYEISISWLVSNLNEKTLQVMLDGLGSAAFEKLHPDQYTGMIRREERHRIAGGKGDHPDDKELWNDWRKVNPWGSILGPRED